MQVTKPVGDNMVRQITVTFGQNDQELTEFLMKRESVSNADAITGINIRNQLYELMRMIEPIR
jgi:PleD family two-component response regulator